MTPWTDIAEYESLRVKSETHKLRHSNHSKLINSGPGQTVMLSSRGAHVTFRIVESGLEIPLENVASAIPKACTLATKTQKTTGSRLTKKVKATPAKPAQGDDDVEPGAMGRARALDARQPRESRNVVA